MKVLVTGGRGLLGSAVVRELAARGHDVTSFQRSPADHGPGVREVLGDVTDADAVAAAIDGHAGRRAPRGPGVDGGSLGGLRGGQRRRDARGPRRRGRRGRGSAFVHVSSPSVAHAGEPLVGAPAGPADPDHARGNYARSKAQAELLALASDRPGLAVTAVRPHLVWGPGDTQLIGRIAERARAGRLVLVDDGAALIDTTYVDNAADAIAQACERCALPEVRGRAFVDLERPAPDGGGAGQPHRAGGGRHAAPSAPAVPRCPVGGRRGRAGLGPRPAARTSRR